MNGKLCVDRFYQKKKKNFVLIDLLRFWHFLLINLRRFWHLDGENSNNVEWCQTWQSHPYKTLAFLIYWWLHQLLLGRKDGTLFYFLSNEKMVH